MMDTDGGLLANLQSSIVIRQGLNPSTQEEKLDSMLLWGYIFQKENGKVVEKTLQAHLFIWGKTNNHPCIAA